MRQIVMTPYFLPFEYPLRKNQRTHRVWVAPVSSRQEELWGTLVLLITLPEDTTNPETISNNLCDLATKLYYPSSAVKRVTQSQTKEREMQFEEMLQELNDSFLNPERFGLPQNDKRAFDVLVGLIHPDQVLFASHRKQSVWFLERFDPTNSEDERLEKITDHSSGDPFFSSVITGSLQTGETMIMASEHFFASWSPETVVHLVDTAKSTEELVETLHTLGKQHDVTQESCALIILGLDDSTTENFDNTQDEGTNEDGGDNEAPEDVKALTRSVVVSMTPLMKTTAHALWLGARWSGKNLVKGLQKMRESSVHFPTLARAVMKGSTRLAVNTLRILSMTWSAIRTFFLVVAVGVVSMIGSPTQQEALWEHLRTEPFARWTRLAPSSAQVSPRWVKTLSIVLVLMVLLTATMLTRHQYERILEQRRMQTQTIVQKAVEARAGIIYGNDRDAQRLLEEARDLLKELPERTNDPIQENIKKELDAVAKQLRHEIELGKPRVDIPALEGAQRLVLNNQVLLAIAPSTIGVYDHAALKAKPVPRKIPLPLNAIERIDSVEMPTATQALIHNGTHIHKVVVGPKTSLSTSTLPASVSTRRSTYNSRLYAVDSGNTTIVKLSPAGASWSTPQPWLAAGAVLPTNPTLLAVDGSIYLATSTALYKYHQGQAQPFLFSVEPALQSPRRLTLVNNASIFLVIDQYNRILVVDKGDQKKENGGRVHAQLVSSAWKNLQDAVIDNKTKTLTVLVDGRIQQYALPSF